MLPESWDWACAAGPSLNVSSSSSSQGRRVQTCTSRGVCLCCCCCNTSVRKNAFLTRLLVQISHLSCLCLVSCRSLSKECSSLCACSRVTQLVRFRRLTLPLYRGNHVEFRVAQERACCASSRGVATEVQRESALDLGWVKVLALSEQWSCGIERSNPRRHCKSGLCQQGRTLLRRYDITRVCNRV